MVLNDVAPIVRHAFVQWSPTFTIFLKRVSSMIKQDWNYSVFPFVGSPPQCCLLQIIRGIQPKSNQFIEEDNMRNCERRLVSKCLKSGTLHAHLVHRNSFHPLQVSLMLISPFIFFFLTRPKHLKYVSQAETW